MADTVYPTIELHGPKPVETVMASATQDGDDDSLETDTMLKEEVKEAVAPCPTRFHIALGIAVLAITAIPVIVPWSITSKVSAPECGDAHLDAVCVVWTIIMWVFTLFCVQNLDFVRRLWKKRVIHQIRWRRSRFYCVRPFFILAGIIVTAWTTWAIVQLVLATNYVGSDLACTEADLAWRVNQTKISVKVANLCWPCGGGPDTEVTWQKNDQINTKWGAGVFATLILSGMASLGFILTVITITCRRIWNRCANAVFENRP